MAGLRYMGVFLCGLGACTDAPVSSPRVATRTEAIIYGDDNRTDPYEVEDPSLRELVRSSLVALIPQHRLHRPPSGSVGLAAIDLAAAYEVCEGERFLSQPTAADCSGVLIDDDLVLTAGHCIEPGKSCDDYAYVFDYFYASEGELETISSSDVYGCRRVVARTVSASDAAEQIDYAVVQLDRPARGRTPVTMSKATVRTGEALTTVGFPSGLPAKIDRGGLVEDARSQTHDYFALDSDTFAGSSGSGVFDAQRKLLGVLVRGGDDYVLDQDAGCNRPNIIPAGADGSPWEQATYAVHARDAVCALGYPSTALCGIAPRCGDGFCTADETSGGCAVDCVGAHCDAGDCEKSGAESGRPSAELPDGGWESDGARRKGRGGCSTDARPTNGVWVLGALSWLALRVRRRRRVGPIG